MKKEQVVKKMKVKQKGRRSLEIANPNIGKNLRAGKMIMEGNETNRP